MNNYNQTHFNIFKARLLMLLNTYEWNSITTPKMFNSMAIEFTIINNKQENCNFYITCNNGNFNIEPYNYYDNNVQITTNWSNLNNYITAHISLNKFISNCSINKDSSTFISFITSINSCNRTYLRKINNNNVSSYLNQAEYIES